MDAETSHTNHREGTKTLHACLAAVLGANVLPQIKESVTLLLCPAHSSCALLLCIQNILVYFAHDCFFLLFFLPLTSHSASVASVAFVFNSLGIDQQW